MSLTLDELTKAANHRRKLSTKNQLSKYHLARELGFSAKESVVLMGHSREIIKNLAIQKGFIINQPGGE